MAGGRLRAEVGDRTALGFSGRYHDARYHFPTDFTGVPVDRNQFTTDETATFALDAAHRLSDVVEGQLLLARSDIETGYENPADPPPGPGFASSDHTSTDRSSADARVQLRLPRRYRGPGRGQLRGPAPARCRTPSTRTRDNWGFYAQASALPFSRAPAHGRRTDGRERALRQLSGPGAQRRSRSCHPLPGCGPRRAPASRSRASSRTSTARSPWGIRICGPSGPSAWRPASSRSWSAGSRAVGVTGFVQRFRDLIQFTFVPPEPGGSNYFNVAAANANGLEATLDARAGPVRGSVAYTRLWTEVTDAGFDAGEAATFVEGERLLRRPDDAVTRRARDHRRGTGAAGREAHLGRPTRRYPVRAVPRAEPADRAAVLHHAGPERSVHRAAAGGGVGRASNSRRESRTCSTSSTSRPWDSRPRARRLRRRHRAMSASGPRVASLLPSGTEIVRALGLEHSLVAVSHSCDFPGRVRTLPRATSTRVPKGASSREIDEVVRACLRRGESLYRLDEALLDRLRPDLIVTQSLCEVCAVGPDEVGRAIPALGRRPTVITLEPHTLEQVFGGILTRRRGAGTERTRQPS